MTKTHITIVILIFLVIGMALVILTQNRYTTRSTVRAEIALSPTPTVVTPAPLEPASMESPDGLKLLTMEGAEMEGVTSYSFVVTDVAEDTRQMVFEKELTLPDHFSIPFNTWSPENTHFFIKQTSTAGDDYYVFLESGEPFAESAPYMDIQARFAEQVEGYVIEDVTGWAAPYLLLVNAREVDGEQKISYWFDVTTQSFIRLGTYFR